MVASDCDKEIMACKTAIEKVGLVTHANQAAPHVLRDTDLDEDTLNAIDQYVRYGWLHPPADGRKRRKEAVQ